MCRQLNFQRSDMASVRYVELNDPRGRSLTLRKTVYVVIQRLQHRYSGDSTIAVLMRVALFELAVAACLQSFGVSQLFERVIGKQVWVHLFDNGSNQLALSRVHTSFQSQLCQPE